MAPKSTGPPKYTLSFSRARRVRSGKSCGTVIRVGLLTTMPTGAAPRLFITSTTEFAKSSSGKSALPTRRIAVRGPVLSADIGDAAPDETVPLDAGMLGTISQGAFARWYAVNAAGAPAVRR